MSRARFFLTGPVVPSQPALLPLTVADARHARRVLRVQPSEELDVVEPSGAGWRVKVSDVTEEGVWAEAVIPLKVVWSPTVTLFQGVAKGDKMDAIVRQAIEVGVTGVVPVLTSRSVVRLDADKRIARGERWRRVAESAAKQARRDVVPHVSDPVDFAQGVELLGEYDLSVVLWEESSGELLGPVVRSRFVQPGMSIALFVGPEGGISEHEIESLIAGGATPVTLGPAILRTETAAVVGSALVIAAARERWSDRA